MLKKIYFYICIYLLFKGYILWPNSPDQNQICFKLYESIVLDKIGIFNSDICYQKGGYIKNVKTESVNGELVDVKYCCNISCGINGTIIGEMCKWIKDKSICKLNSNLYYINEISIFGSRYISSSNLLSLTYDIFKFDIPSGCFCSFQTKEDLLINFANQINGRFIYSLGGGHNHFDERLMDTSEGRGSIEKPFLLYPTYGIEGFSGGVNYDDRNVLGYDCSGLSMALIDLINGYNFDRENTNAQKMYDIAKENNLLKNELKIGYAIFYGKSENSISHVTIALGENKMIEASGHNPDKTGKPIQIVNIRNNMIGIADFISVNQLKSNFILYLKPKSFLLFVILFI